MSESATLKPLDAGVLLYLCFHPGATYGEMAEALGTGKSSAHRAIARLAKSGLVADDDVMGIQPNRGAALEFLQFGAPYAFPAQRVAKARGIATGFSAPMLTGGMSAERDPLVWPSTLGTLVGAGVRPLFAGAVQVSFQDAPLYESLALMDALRVGDAREREIARARLGEMLGIVTPVGVPR